MKLLFVGTNPGGGGTETHFITLARAMADEGHQVVAVVHPEGKIKTALQDGAVVLRPGIFRNAADPRGIRAVRAALRELQPDWMIGSFSKEYWPLAMLARSAGVRLVLFKHMDKPMRPLTHRFIPQLADRFIVISEYMRRRFIERGVPPERLQVLYNPLDLNHFQPDSELRGQTRAALGLSESDVLVGFIGALHPGKGIFVLADALDQAMAQNPDIRALWVGQGEAEADFSARLQASPHADRHIRKGWTDDVRPWYAAMDLLALPSIEPDSFGRVCIEAQACGVPVLGSDLGGIPETLVADETGKLLPPGDSRTWQQAIQALAADALLRTQMGQAGQGYISSRFAARAIVQDFEQLLTSENRLPMPHH